MCFIIDSFNIYMYPEKESHDLNNSGKHFFGISLYSLEKYYDVLLKVKNFLRLKVFSCKELP